MIAAFSALVCAGIAVRIGGRFVFVTVQVNVTLAVLFAAPRPSATVTVTACRPDVVYDTVPPMTPVAVLIVRPCGNPIAL